MREAIKLTASRTVGWTQPSISQNVRTFLLITGRNAREFSKSQGGRCGGPSPVPAGMLTLFGYWQGGMPANFQIRKAVDGMVPAQCQLECSHFISVTGECQRTFEIARPTVVRTQSSASWNTPFFLNVQDGMPAKFPNRKPDGISRDSDE